MIFCAAADPGGSRALLPVIGELLRRGSACRILNHGFLGKELPEQYRAMLLSATAMEQRLPVCTAFLFGSSTTDALPLCLARKAKAAEKPVVHVLDNWGSYYSRLITDGGELLVPDVYAVMDAAAAQGAAAEGVPSHCLAVTGHPGLAEVASTLETLRNEDRRAVASGFGFPTDRYLLAFICEPFSEVFGTNVTVPGHPGFTQETVLPAFASALTPHADRVFLALLPHPKQSPEMVDALWQQCKGSLQGRVAVLKQGRDILRVVDGVTGMASILLYEAWLVGLPVLSLQPGGRIPALKRFALFEGIVYVDAVAEIAHATDMWLNQCTCVSQARARPELGTHTEAPGTIANLLLRYARP